MEIWEVSEILGEKISINHMWSDRRRCRFQLESIKDWNSSETKVENYRFESENDIILEEQNSLNQMWNNRRKCTEFPNQFDWRLKCNWNWAKNTDLKVKICKIWQFYRKNFVNQMWNDRRKYRIKLHWIEHSKKTETGRKTSIWRWK